MPIFQLILRSSLEELPETLQFIAPDVPGALIFANQHRSPLPAELWRDGDRVCNLVCSESDGVWSVAPDTPEAKAN